MGGVHLHTCVRARPFSTLRKSTDASCWHFVCCQKLINYTFYIGNGKRTSALVHVQLHLLSWFGSTRLSPKRRLAGHTRMNKLIETSIIKSDFWVTPTPQIIFLVGEKSAFKINWCAWAITPLRLLHWIPWLSGWTSRSFSSFLLNVERKYAFSVSESVSRIHALIRVVFSKGFLQWCANLKKGL